MEYHTNNRLHELSTGQQTAVLIHRRSSTSEHSLYNTQYKQSYALESSDGETGPSSGSSLRKWASANGPPDDGRGNDDQTLRIVATSNDLLSVLHSADGPNVQLTHSALPLSSVTTMLPDVTQFPDWFPANSWLRRLSLARRSHTGSAVSTTRRPRRTANYSFALTDTQSLSRSHTALNFTNNFNSSITDNCRPLLDVRLVRSQYSIYRIILRSLANSLTHVVSLTLCRDVTHCYRQSRN